MNYLEKDLKMRNIEKNIMRERKTGEKVIIRKLLNIGEKAGLKNF